MFKYKKSTVEETTTDISKDAVIGKDLKGHPTQIDDAIGERLAASGIAAKVDEGWVRGHKWHNVYGG